MISRADVVMSAVAGVLAAACVVASAALRESSGIDATRAIATTSVLGDVPMDFGVYLTPENAGTLESLAVASRAAALLPEPNYTWNLRVPTAGRNVLFWYGPADTMSLFEGVQSASNRNGLWGGRLDAPVSIRFLLPESASTIASCARWSDSTGIHSVPATVVNSAPHVVVSCEIPAIGAFESLHIVLEFGWEPSAEIDPVRGITSIALENQAFPVVSMDADLTNFGFAQPLQVDIFTPADDTILQAMPAANSANPIQSRWQLPPGDSIFSTQVNSTRRNLTAVLEQLMLIAAGAFFAVAVERVFRGRRSKDV